MASYTDDTLERIPPKLLPGEKEHVLIMQDETVFHTNEYRRRTWLAQDQQPIRKKGAGRAVHVSDFICETIGCLKLSEEQIKDFVKTRKITIEGHDLGEEDLPGTNNLFPVRFVSKKLALETFHRLFPDHTFQAV